MTAPTIPDVMTALKVRLATISGLETRDFTPGNIVAPMAWVAVPTIDDYRETFTRGTVIVRYKVYVATSRAVDSEGQRKLALYASYTGAESIPLALEGDPTLGGIASSCVVEAFTPVDLTEASSLGFYGGEFTTLVVTPGV